MTEQLPPPDSARFPDLSRDPDWVREVPAGTALTRIFLAGGEHPSQWFDFRSYGPVDARFDPHPEPVGTHDGESVLYASIERQVRDAGAAELPAAADSPFAVCVLEVFQQLRIIRRSSGAPTVVIFETTRPLRLLDLSESDWVTVAGGNAALSSGEHVVARAWARAIRLRYPELDGVISASALVPSARTVALWEPAKSSLPQHPLALLRLDRAELTGVIDAIAERYGYLLI